MADGVVWSVVYDKFPAIIAGMAPQADRICRKAALDIQARAQQRAAVRTGAMRSSIHARRVGPAHWEVNVGVEYGLYVEYGTIHMAAQPFMRPSVAEVQPQFQNAMKGVIKGL